MDQRIPRARWIAVWCFAVLWILLIVGRLSYLQLYRYSDYLSRAQRQQEHMVEVNPERGTIYDRRGRELAVSIPMDDLVADPGEVKDPAMVARLLSRVIEIPAEEIEKKLDDANEIFPLARKLTPEQAARVGDLNCAVCTPRKKITGCTRSTIWPPTFWGSSTSTSTAWAASSWNWTK